MECPGLCLHMQKCDPPPPPPQKKKNAEKLVYMEAAFFFLGGGGEVEGRVEARGLGRQIEH